VTTIEVEPDPADGPDQFRLQINGHSFGLSRGNIELLREACGTALNGARLPAQWLPDAAELTCPHCGSSFLRYVETETTHRALFQLRRGKLRIDSTVLSGGDADDERLACMNCSATLEIPDNLELEWV
jgi:DNA-directed RNA polymerase subunit RPC12/RpoP